MKVSKEILINLDYFEFKSYFCLSRFNTRVANKNEKTEI